MGITHLFTRSPAKTQTWNPALPTNIPAVRAWVEAQHLGARCGLMTDIDGTLSAIAASPSDARLTPGVADALRHCIASFTLVATITGRSAADAYQMVRVRDVLYSGNYGLDWFDTRTDPPTQQINPDALAIRPALTDLLQRIAREILPRFPDVVIEDKGVTGSIHYRNTPHPTIARHAILACIWHAAKPDLRVSRGKMVVEVRPALQTDKGSVVRDLAARYRLGSILSFGDDIADILAFRAVKGLQAMNECVGLTVAVAQHATPAALLKHADIVLSSTDEVPTLLNWLAAQ